MQMTFNRLVVAWLRDGPNLLWRVQALNGQAFEKLAIPAVPYQ
jgi:hypothetical protein